MDEQPIAGETPAFPVPVGTVPAGLQAGEGGTAADSPVTAQAEAETDSKPLPGQAEADSPWSDPRLPWEGKPRRVDIACWAAITLSGLYYLAILPWRASLIGTHPLISVALNGSTEAIVSAAAFARVGRGSLAVVLLVAVPATMKFDIIYWWAGRLWGERILNLFAGRSKRQQRRGLKFVARVDRWGRWFMWPAVVISPFLPIPNAIIYAVAGWTGMGWVTFLILDAIGSLAFTGMLAGLGWALGQHAVTVAEKISNYGLWVALAIVVVVVLGQIRGARARK